MSDSMLLMLKDTPVMRINMEECLYSIIDNNHLPYQLKGKFRFYKVNESLGMEYNLRQLRNIDMNNYNVFISFLASRVLPLDRENAKKILRVLRLEQSQTPQYRAKIALSYRAVSLQDNYWVKLEKDKLMWKDVSIRDNKLSRIVAQVALHGSSLSLQGKVHTPELTTQGAYAKCWVRENGDLYLYKRGYRGDKESRIEVEVSDILDKCNVNHVKYESTHSEGVFCCKCKCMTDDTISMISANELESFCISNNLNFMSEIFRIDSESIYKMMIVDYLISNTDRHGYNWGFLYNCNTMQILGCHPLFDHNNAFDDKEMKNLEGGDSALYKGVSMKKAALNAMRHVNFKFTSKITRKDFIYNEHYKSFMKRAKVLGLI